MRLALALAALAALVAAPASAQRRPAQTPTPAATTSATTSTGEDAGKGLADENILWQEMPTYDRQLDISFVSADGEREVTTAAVKVSRLVNSEELSLRDDSVTLTPDCGSEPPYPLKFGKNRPCSLRATLNQRKEPGLYTARVSLFGPNGERKEARLKFAVRRSVGLAAALVLAGLVVGFVVTSWRGSGRERTRKVIAVKQAAEALALLDTGVGVAPRMTQILAWASEMVDALIEGRPVDDAEIAILQSRVSEYRFILEVERAGADLPDDKRRELAQFIFPVIDAMQPTAANRLVAVPQTRFDEIRKKLRDLQASATPRLESAESAIPPELMPLPVTARMSSRTARLAYLAAEWGVAVTLMLVFAASAISTLYYGKTAWGSPGDMIGAFLVGFAAYAGAVASVDSFMQRARATS